MMSSEVTWEMSMGTQLGGPPGCLTFIGKSISVNSMLQKYIYTTNVFIYIHANYHVVVLVIKYVNAVHL